MTEFSGKGVAIPRIIYILAAASVLLFSQYQGSKGEIS